MKLLVSFISSLITVIMYISLFYLFISILGSLHFFNNSFRNLGLAVGLALQEVYNLAGGVLILFFQNHLKKVMEFIQRN